MFRALKRDTAESITLIDPRWLTQQLLLRAWSRDDDLCCPRCDASVRARMGRERRWHFAHKQRTDCPSAHESVTLLNLRATLYEWLLHKFAGQPAVHVTLEHPAPGPLPRPVDCWVETPQGAFAYWIVDAALRPEGRDILSEGLRQLDATPTMVFNSDFLRLDEVEPNHLNLSTTERDLVQLSRYDAPHALYSLGSLHYLDAMTAQLHTVRAVRLVHAPQMHQGALFINPLENVLVQPTTGEFVHPGEYELVQRYLEERRRKQEAQALAQAAKEANKKAQPPPRHSPPSIADGNPVPGSVYSDQPWPQPSMPSPPQPTPTKKAPCLHCGVVTDNWWWHDGESNTCKCRVCYRKGLY
jgi:hypothetical protein